MINDRTKIEISVLISALAVLLVALFFTINGAEEVDAVYYDHTEYVKIAMDAACNGEYFEYISVYDEASDIAQVHADMIHYFTDMIFFRYSLDKECVSAETIAEFDLLTERLLKKVSFSVGTAKQVNNVYYVEVGINPINVWPLADAFCGIYQEDYNNKLASGELAQYSDEEWNKYMQEYALNVLGGLQEIQQRVAGTMDKRVITIAVNVDDEGKYYITESEWFVIEDYLIGIK